MSESKCEMARLEYCKLSKDGCCDAPDVEQLRCPYLNAIGEIARLAIQTMAVEFYDK